MSYPVPISNWLALLYTNVLDTFRADIKRPCVLKVSFNSFWSIRSEGSASHMMSKWGREGYRVVTALCTLSARCPSGACLLRQTAHICIMHRRLVAHDVDIFYYIHYRPKPMSFARMSRIINSNTFWQLINIFIANIFVSLSYLRFFLLFAISTIG